LWRWRDDRQPDDFDLGADHHDGRDRGDDSAHGKCHEFDGISDVDIQ